MRFWALFCITYSASSNFPFLYLLCLFLVPFSPLHPNSVTVSTHYSWFPWWSDSKEPACNVGHPGLIPGLGRSPGDANGNPLQYFYLENSMNGRAYSPLGRKRVGHSWATNTPPRTWIFYNRTFEQNLSKAFEQRQLISITINLSRLTTGSAVEVDKHQIPWCAGVPV